MSTEAPYFVNHDRRLRFPWSLYHRELSDRLASALENLCLARDEPSAPRVLVVGCGLEPFVPGVQGISWYGADLDEASVRECQRLFPEMAPRLALCKDAHTLPDEGLFSEPFDAIVAKEVIEHLDEPERWVEELASHLAPGGQLLLTTPNYGRFSSLAFLEATVLEWVARFDGYSRRNIHPSRFDRKRLEELKIANNVQLAEVHTTRTGWALFGRWHKRMNGIADQASL